jgi:DNA-binding response OmpR family regulator
VADGAEPVKQKLRVLIVEDDAMIGLLLGDVLEGMGHDVCAIEATEAGAVAAAARYRPGLMIVDARLSDESGISAVADILLTGFIPHLFVSGNLSQVRLLRPDAVTLQKPYREAELMSAIQCALDIVPA